jgi:hypothetical protein
MKQEATNLKKNYINKTILLPNQNSMYQTVDLFG